MKRIIAALLIVFATQVFAGESADPLRQVYSAISEHKAANTNAFAGYGGICIGGGYTSNTGFHVLSSSRQCFTYFLSRAAISAVAANAGWPMVSAGVSVDIYKSADGGAYYYVVYNKAGQASEVVVILDSTTD